MQSVPQSTSNPEEIYVMAVWRVSPCECLSHALSDSGRRSPVRPLGRRCSPPELRKPLYRNTGAGIARPSQHCVAHGREFG